MKLLCLLMLTGVACGSVIRKLQQFPEPGENAGPTRPCQAERESAGPKDLLPECDEFGFHLPKQCNADATVCWCVSRCGDALFETKGGPELVCEQADPPCQTALGESNARGVRFGKFKPSCREDGFYDLTQCLGTICWCTDRCGNRMDNSKHYIWNRGFCDCPNDDQAWKCESNPCDDVEESACPAHPDAVCKPFICGGCSYKFYVDHKEMMDCAIPEPDMEPEPELEQEVIVTTCKDWNETVRENGEQWKEGRCISCFCSSGVKACSSPMCMGPPAGQQCRVRPGTENDCCHEFDCEDPSPPQTCNPAVEVPCPSGDKCVHYSALCDGVNDCPSGMDETNCAGLGTFPPHTCDPFHIPCPSGDKCIHFSALCNGVTDCPSGIDETNCTGVGVEHSGQCPSHTFPCSMSEDKCIPRTALCDGVKDCPNGMDEMLNCAVIEEVIVTTCKDWNETVRENGEQWKEGRCISCFCSSGVKACSSPMCMGPPAGQQCRVRPGTENDCCHEYDCEGCVDTMGNHYTVGEIWGDPCNRCECKGDQDASCKTEVCIDLNPGIVPPCHWVIQPDECCPRDTGPGGTVCDEPISVCPPGSSVAPECPTHLCQEVTCQNHPDALCMISRCGACHTAFYLEGYKVECGNDPITIEPVCPEMVSMFCIMSPCLSEACTNHPQAVCYTNYCEPCQAVYYDENDRPLICGDPLNKEVIFRTCKDWNETVRENGEQWKEGRCMSCFCSSGVKACSSPMCMGPPAGQQCRVRPGTENDCCHEFDCEDPSSPQTCNPAVEVPCPSGDKCVHYSALCDGVNDCPSGMDETNCAGLGPFPPHTCDPFHIPCPSGDKCIHFSALCNGVTDCPSGIDETNCTGVGVEHSGQCPSHTFPCSMSEDKCIPRTTLCDGVKDCPNGMDEMLNCAVIEEVIVTTCKDWNGTVRENGEQWKEGRCKSCFCSSGVKACSSPMCMGPPAGQQCRVRPGTENDCCHEFDCEVSRHCVLPDGTIHIHGHKWNVGKCMNCLCNNGSSECMSPMCAGPPMGDQYCTVRPGTEQNCCPDYDCEGCVDTMGNHYTVGEIWGDPCNRCECKGDQDAFCKTEVCIGLNRGIVPPCHWVIQPDECCPRDTGPGGTVCDEPISACPPGSNVAPECPTHLCQEATCQNHPDALCMISRCGACHTAFYLEGYKVECGNDPITIEPVCPEMVSMFCIMSPCPSEACTNHPQAVCYTNYCEPCQAVFYDKNDRPLICGDPLYMLVECKDLLNTKRAVGDTWEEGCNECTCEASGIPKCTAKKCAIDRSHLPPLCEVVYGEVDKCCPAHIVCYEAISECPWGSRVALSCPDDLCVSATCEMHPQAKCRISRCGGCSAKFFDESKRPIEECTGLFVDLQTVCPNVGRIRTCVAPACLDPTCASNPDLTCHADSCQPCTPVYHDEYNNMQLCTSVPEECMDSSNTNTYAVNEMWEEDCNVCTCRGNGMATCIAKSCAIDGSHLSPMCEVVYGEVDKCCPARMVCYEAISECPWNSMVALSCPDDLCVSATCEMHPQAKCRISRCGGCSAKFFDESKRPIEECTGKSVDLHTVCPNFGPVLTCFAPACLDPTCASNPDLTCHADVCQPCTPVFHDDNNNLLSCTSGTAHVCNQAVKILTPRGTRTHPRCRWDGKFSPKQCDNMGYCWCVEADGSMADTRDHSQTGHELICGFSPPCQYEVKINKVKKERGKTVTFNPTCLTNGFYDTVQCNAEECWCSEKDGTMVIGSMKPQGEPLKCSSVCLGDAARTISGTFCTRTHNNCPSNSFCHIPTNRSSGRCCYL